VINLPPRHSASRYDTCTLYGTLGRHLLAILKEVIYLIRISSGDNITIENGYKIGWQPKWNKERFLQHVDDEIDAVLELGKAKSSLVDSMFESARE